MAPLQSGLVKLIGVKILIVIVKLRLETLEDRRLLTSVGVGAVDSLAVEGVDNNYGSWQIS